MNYELDTRLNFYFNISNEDNKELKLVDKELFLLMLPFLSQKGKNRGKKGILTTYFYCKERKSYNCNILCKTMSEQQDSVIYESYFINGIHNHAPNKIFLEKNILKINHKKCNDLIKNELKNNNQNNVAILAKICQLKTNFSNHALRCKITRLKSLCFKHDSDVCEDDMVENLNLKDKYNYTHKKPQN
ncbi:hypothetical protein EHP00_1369 [Ecytonucleospora hepatopenaei]|uniref:Uncharacterized protein n=1 Tax=Ecytonucleospora hepatopenaei TaxID=646526 RepID=A0A1W0E2X6_9MICR|nr:hypothetical protein EHP00_1369 [Ecytonucleospora hepatopenaei]